MDAVTPAQLAEVDACRPSKHRRQQGHVLQLCHRTQSARIHSRRVHRLPLSLAALNSWRAQGLWMAKQHKKTASRVASRAITTSLA